MHEWNDFANTFPRPIIALYGIKYGIIQNFGSRKLWKIGAWQHFGGENNGGLAAL